MTAIQKNVFQALTSNQHSARINMTPRGREIERRLAKRPAISVEEEQALSLELGQLISASQQAELDAALAAGLFWQEPGPRQWPSTTFGAEEPSAVGKSLRKALEAIR